MEHREEADLGSEMLGVEGNLQPGFSAGPEQQVVEELLVLEHQWRELVGQGKDHVEVADCEQFFLASRLPAATSCYLTLWAMPIATRMEDDDPMAATGTLVEMSPQDRGTTVSDGAEHFLVRPVDPAAVVGDQAFALRPCDVGHL
jgi:hypothetical protein